MESMEVSGVHLRDKAAANDGKLTVYICTYVAHMQSYVCIDSEMFCL